MSAQQSFVGRDLYYEVTMADGRSSVCYARVWDAELFIAEQRESGAKAAHKDDRYTIATATREDYVRQNGRRH